MLTGICVLPVIPMRKKKSDKSEMINQILFGETFYIIKKLSKWSYIELTHDRYQGWIDNKQYELIQSVENNPIISNKKICQITLNNKKQPLILGSLIPKNKYLTSKFKISHNLSFGQTNDFDTWFLKIAKKYLNSPYLWGGRTPLGIDCSGYTQMVYRFFKIQLPRDASEQVNKGESILNLRNAKLGDLVFFSEKEYITHVGIYLGQNRIIHSSGKVRIDTLDQKGIFNTDSKSYTHILQIIKRLI